MINESDLVITPSGKIYHLDLLPEEVSDSIIIVGDPKRSTQIAKSFFEKITITSDHRGLITNTGTINGKALTVTTSGMGTPSLEIVLNELAALKFIDFKTRKMKSSINPFDIIRVGTSGGLREETELGTLIISDYAVGLDNTGIFYKRDQNPYSDLEREFQNFLGIKPYISRFNPEVIKALKDACKEIGVPYKIGSTVSNSGFFANQGRELLVEPAFPDIDQKLTTFSSLTIENMEMEASFLSYFSSLLPIRAGCICVAIANRAKNTFAKNPDELVRAASEAALRALLILKG